jgi:hypothetical protein
VRQYAFDVRRDEQGHPIGLKLVGIPPHEKAGLVYAAEPEVILGVWRFLDWNTLRIRVAGALPRLTTWINGLKVAEMDAAKLERENYDRSKVLNLLGPRGHIAFEVHDNDAKLGPDRWAPNASFAAVIDMDLKSGTPHCRCPHHHSRIGGPIRVHVKRQFEVAKGLVRHQVRAEAATGRILPSHNRAILHGPTAVCRRRPLVRFAITVGLRSAGIGRYRQSRNRFPSLKGSAVEQRDWSPGTKGQGTDRCGQKSAACFGLEHGPSSG